MSPAFITGLILRYGYVFIFLTAPFLGPIVSLLSGALVRLELLALAPVIIALMASELIADVLWYWLGYHQGERFVRRFGKYFGITDVRIAEVKVLYHRYHDRIILVSKLTAGFGIAPVIFFTAGFARTSFHRYMAMNVIGQIIWTPIMLAIGYYLGHYYLQVNSVLEKSAILGGTVLAVIVLIALGRTIATRTLDSQKL